jgi:hypothetical protein
VTREPNFAGDFETHITVAPPVVESTFRRDCLKLGVKPILIHSPVDAAPARPMTSAIYRGDLPSVLAESKAVGAALKDMGYSVVRLKIEAGPENADLPENDSQAAAMPTEYYFEHHLKILLDDPDGYDQIALLCRNRQAHLSPNALLCRSGGEREYFITLRSYSVGRDNAESQVEVLIADLELVGVPILKKISDYCVYDDNPSSDDGWP